MAKLALAALVLALSGLAGASLGSRLASGPACFPGMTRVALDHQRWCMTDHHLRWLSSGWCGSSGRFVRIDGTWIIGTCDDVPFEAR